MSVTLSIGVSSPFPGSRESAARSSRSSDVGCGPLPVKHETQVIEFPATSRRRVLGNRAQDPSSSSLAKLSAPVAASRANTVTVPSGAEVTSTLSPSGEMATSSCDDGSSSTVNTSWLSVSSQVRSPVSLLRT